MVMLYESCWGFHQESKNFLVCIFMVFLQLSTDFTIFSKTTTLLKILVFNQVPGTLQRVTSIPLLRR
jgi:hypothetical protein